MYVYLVHNFASTSDGYGKTICIKLQWKKYKHSWARCSEHIMPAGLLNLKKIQSENLHQSTQSAEINQPTD